MFGNWQDYATFYAKPTKLMPWIHHFYSLEMEKKPQKLLIFIQKFSFSMWKRASSEEISTRKCILSREIIAYLAEHGLDRPIWAFIMAFIRYFALKTYKKKSIIFLRINFEEIFSFHWNYRTFKRIIHKMINLNTEIVVFLLWNVCVNIAAVV